MSETKKFSFELAGRPLTLETGKIALQANGSCTITYGETVVLSTAVMSKQAREGIDFFPLSVEYEERLYAAGKIKGSRWVKREGRPSDEAVLTGRLVDRAIRPLFPEGVRNEVQVVNTVLSFDTENDADIASMIGSAAALAISDIPWNGPLGGVRIGRVAGELVVNPTFKQREDSDLDLIVAGLNQKVIMVEAGAKQISEDDMYQAIELAMKSIQQIIDFINEVKKSVGKEKLPLEKFLPKLTDEQKAAQAVLKSKVAEWAKNKIEEKIFAKTLDTKSSRKEAIGLLQDELAEFLSVSGETDAEVISQAKDDLYGLVEAAVTENILKNDRRVDGRSLTDIRVLNAETSCLPRTHGSAIFSRGETQVLSVVTLGAPGDVQVLEGLEESGKKHYMHHYNFPPYSVGETGRMGSPGRREIGHGALAERALIPVLPPKEQFPYTIRVVSEVMGSNGSSSMASTCGSTLSLMDAGVPILKPVAGVAMGLASDGQGNYKVLTDLQDLEDGEGGMDFKITGTDSGITAMQMDTKTDGLPMSIVKQTLTQGLEARLKIIEKIVSAIAAPRVELSQYAPRIISFKIPVDKIRDVIGPGGKMINEIIDATGVQIDIEDDGTVFITSPDGAGGQKAQDWIRNLTREVVAGEIFTGKVTRILDFGAFVEVLPKQEGLVHISELAWERVNSVTDKVQIGDTVTVKVIEIDDQGRINLSIKQTLPKPEDYVEPAPREPFHRSSRPSFGDRRGGGQRGGRPFRR